MLMNMIRKFKLDVKWHIRALKRLQQPPLPPDLTGLFSIDRHWLYRTLYDDPLWLRAFKRESKYVNEIGSWISTFLFLASCTGDVKTAYEMFAVDRIYEGWHTRQIIDNF